MKITLDIQDNKLSVFLEFIKTLDYVSLSSGEMEIPEEHKAIVRDRIRTAKTEDMVAWKDARKQFSYKKDKS